MLSRLLSVLPLSALSSGGYLLEWVLQTVPMRRIMITVASVLVLASTACSSTESAEPAKSAAATAAAPTQAEMTAKEKKYLAGLKKIDEGLAANEERAIRRAQNICLDVKGGEFNDKQLADRAAERLSGGDATIDSAQGAKVVALAKANIC
ncbi:hypothetical protein ACFO0M_20225 [Micromonospora mangrovi]|uniref:DUF732 domain-containing protein n=2 Tax=Micromonospora TaxID=1873 RepID=A0AAU8HBG0_9ACTN